MIAHRHRITLSDWTGRPEDKNVLSDEELDLNDRIELAKHFAMLGFTTGAEIGVCQGRYSEILCRTNPKLKLLAVDDWRRNRTHKSCAVAYRRLAKLNVTIDRRSSMDAVVDVADESLDFVFIDADHKYTSVCNDIQEWSKKVRIGGIVSGHDYYKTRGENLGVINAVDEYVAKHGYTLQLTNKIRRSDAVYFPMDPWGNALGRGALTNWASLTTDDRQPSWYFTKTG